MQSQGFNRMHANKWHTGTKRVNNVREIICATYFLKPSKFNFFVAKISVTRFFVPSIFIT